MPGKPASEGQRRYLANLTTPERLAALTAAEARFLIDFLLGPPPNATRSQQLYLADLLVRLPPDWIRGLIGELAAREAELAPPPAQRIPSPPPASAGRGL